MMIMTFYLNTIVSSTPMLALMESKKRGKKTREVTEAYRSRFSVTVLDGSDVSRDKQKSADVIVRVDSHKLNASTILLRNR